jgi:hypothetical protein
MMVEHRSAYPRALRSASGIRRLVQCPSCPKMGVTGVTDVTLREFGVTDALWLRLGGRNCLYGARARSRTFRPSDRSSVKNAGRDDINALQGAVDPLYFRVRVISPF